MTPAAGRLLDDGAAPSDTHAVVVGRTMVDLNDLIPANSGWYLEATTGINNRGQIVGYGLHGGQQRAFLLTPTHG